jgi:hypothetical protein
MKLAEVKQNPAATFTIKEAAALLDVDRRVVATLVNSHGIEPARCPRNRLAKLLTWDQVSYLKSVIHPAR